MSTKCCERSKVNYKWKQLSITQVESGQRLNTTFRSDCEILLKFHLTWSRNERVETVEGKLSDDKLSDKFGCILLEPWKLGIGYGRFKLRG